MLLLVLGWRCLLLAACLLVLSVTAAEGGGEENVTRPENVSFGDHGLAPPRVVVSNNKDGEPQLNGFHLDITVVAENLGMINSVANGDETSNPDGTSPFEYSGFIIDVLNALATPKRANFTYTFKTASGRGSLCPPEASQGDPYSLEFRGLWSCAQSDVTDQPRTNYSSDMYIGSFYVTPERRRLNHFTIPLYPPTTGTLAMFGTATNVVDFDDFVKQQEAGKMGPACIATNTAYGAFVKENFPTMNLVEVQPGNLYNPLFDRTCDVFILGRVFAASFVKARFQNDECTNKDGQPFGIIGDALGFGLNYFAFGIRNDLPKELVDTLDYWLLQLMTCSPTKECPEDSLAVLYPENGGTGRECGYVQFPVESKSGLSGKIVAVIVVAVVVFVVAISSLVYLWKLKQQEKRFRKRFVQQIARNISIGPSPSCIPVEKLAEEVQHIGNKDGTITKAELLQWMCDVKLEFISDRDFNALWDAMDLENKGEVNAIDFFVFLSACGDEFGQVYQEQANMPKTERLKWAARRLSNINKLGEDGVCALQHRLERGSWHASGRTLQTLNE